MQKAQGTQLVEIAETLAALMKGMDSLKEGRGSPSPRPRKGHKVDHDDDEDDDTELVNLSARLKGVQLKPADRKVTFAETPAASDSPLKAEDGLTQQMIAALTQQTTCLSAMMANQRTGQLSQSMEMFDCASTSSNIAFANGLRSEADRQAWVRMVVEQPEKIVSGYHQILRHEGRAQEGETYNPTIYGEKVLAAEWKAHQTFQRF
jgi:hypothetical protein